MSNYTRLTKHPVTGKIEMADWLDDHFGHYRYGVRFPDGHVFRADDHKWEFGDDPCADTSKRYGKKTSQITENKSS